MDGCKCKTPFSCSTLPYMDGCKCKTPFFNPSLLLFKFCLVSWMSLIISMIFEEKSNNHILNWPKEDMVWYKSRHSRDCITNNIRILFIFYPYFIIGYKCVWTSIIICMKKLQKANHSMLSFLTNSDWRVIRKLSELQCQSMCQNNNLLEYCNQNMELAKLTFAF